VQRLQPLRELELLLQHNAWAKGCTALGALTQLHQLSIKGRPLDESCKHGCGALSGAFWRECVSPLVGLTRLDCNPWVKAADSVEGRWVVQLGWCVC
jgi:hypothetical protein